MVQGLGQAEGSNMSKLSGGEGTRRMEPCLAKNQQQDKKRSPMDLTPYLH